MNLSYLSLLGAVTPVFVAMLAGYVCRRRGVLSAEADRTLIGTNITLLTPCLMLDKIVGNPALRDMSNVVAAPLLGFGTVWIGFVIGRWVARWFPDETAAQRGTFAVTTGLYNYGYIPLPLILTLFSPEVAGVLFIFNVGVEMALWTVGVGMFSGTRQSGGWRKAINAPTMAIIAGLTLNATHAYRWLPTAVLESIHLLGQAAIPVGLLLIGATFGDHFTPQTLKGGKRIMITSVVLRVVLTPLLFVALAVFLPITDDLRRVLVVQGAMPAAVVPVVLARHYGGDARVAVQVILATSLVALLTIPFWIAHGLQFAGIR